jgi:hypothetical protein
MALAPQTVPTTPSTNLMLSAFGIGRSDLQHVIALIYVSAFLIHSVSRSGRIIDALQSVTKRDSENYADFVRRASANLIGRRVKLADLHLKPRGRPKGGKGRSPPFPA